MATPQPPKDKPFWKYLVYYALWPVYKLIAIFLKTEEMWHKLLE